MRSLFWKILYAVVIGQEMKGMIKFIASFCPLISIRFILKSYIIK